MSKRTREVWHCDVCGWEWLPEFNKVPERCPNRECRKRNWNRAGEVVREIPDVGQRNATLPPGPSNPIFVDHDYRAHSDERSKAIWNSLKHSGTCRCLICKPPQRAK